MKKSLILLMMALISAFAATAQGPLPDSITVASARGQNPGEFVKRTLLGRGVAVYNVKFNGQADSINTDQVGTFVSNAFSGFGMDSGIVMTTGRVDVAPGPNDTRSKCAPVEYVYRDVCMNDVVSGSVNACSTIDFDFVSLSDMVSFNYTFASEEYPEYVCSSFNDAFAFFVTGPDPSDSLHRVRTWNVATIPNTVSEQNPDGIPVAINTVNDTAGAQESCTRDYQAYYRDNPEGSKGIQYDGYTVKMAAVTQILPCEFYHMHLSVCNIGDNAYDSGVFLEYESFNGGVAHMGFGVPADQPKLVGWNEEKVMGLDISSTGFADCNSRLTFGGTAVYGEDYLCYVNGDEAVPAEGRNVLLRMNDANLIKVVGLRGPDETAQRKAELCFSTKACPSAPDIKVEDTIHITFGPFSADAGRPEALTAKIYPNPADSRLVVECEGLRRVEIYSVAGPMVYESECSGSRHEAAIDQLPSGFYRVRVVADAGVLEKSVVVR